MFCKGDNIIIARVQHHFTWSPDKFNLLAFGIKLLLESLIVQPKHAEEKWPAICTSQDSDQTVQFNICCLAFDKQDEHLPG